MATYVPPKRATAFIIYVGLESQAAAGTFKANPTLAAGDFKVSKDGGALANLTDLPTVTPASGKMVKITLTATEMTADNVTVVCSDAAGAEWYDLIINIATAANQVDDIKTDTAAILEDTGTTLPAAVADVPTVAEFEARTLAAASYFDPAADTVVNVTNVVNLTNAPTAGDLTATMKTSVTAAATAATPTVAAVAGNVTGSVGSVAAGGITATSIATGAIDADALATDAVTEITAAILALAYEGSETVQTLLRIMRAFVAGTTSGGNTASPIFKSADGNTNRIAMTVDTDGDRSSVTVNGA